MDPDDRQSTVRRQIETKNEYTSLQPGDLVEFHEIYTGLGETDIAIGIVLESPDKETSDLKVFILQDTFEDNLHVGKTTIFTYKPTDNDKDYRTSGYKSKVFLLA